MTRTMHGKNLSDDGFDSYIQTLLRAKSQPDRMRTLEWIIEIQTSRIRGIIIRFTLYFILNICGIWYLGTNFVKEPCWGSGTEFAFLAIFGGVVLVHDLSKIRNIRKSLREAIVASVMES